MAEPARHWVKQIAVPLPPGCDPADIPEIVELDAQLNRAIPDSDWITTASFVADETAERASLTDTVEAHQREGPRCACQWMAPTTCPPDRWAAVHAQHVAGVFEDSVRVRTSA